MIVVSPAALVIVSVALSGCAAPLVMQRHVDQITIMWHRTNVPDAVCRAKGVQSSATVAGCALVSEGRCEVWMPQDAPDWLVAHELKHCFGWGH